MDVNFDCLGSTFTLNIVSQKYLWNDYRFWMDFENLKFNQKKSYVLMTGSKSVGHSQTYRFRYIL